MRGKHVSPHRNDDRGRALGPGNAGEIQRYTHGGPCECIKQNQMDSKKQQQQQKNCCIISIQD